MQSEQSKPKTQISEPHLFSAQETAPEVDGLTELENEALATVVLAGGSCKAGQRLLVTMGVALTMVGAVVYSGMSLTRAEDREPNGEDRGVTVPWKAEKMQTVAPDPADQIQVEAQVQGVTVKRQAQQIQAGAEIQVQKAQGDGQQATVAKGELEWVQREAAARLAGAVEQQRAAEAQMQTVTFALTTVEQDTRMEGHQGIVLSVQFSPQGDRVVTGGQDGTARLWDLQGQELTKFEGHQGSVYEVQFSPQGDRIVTRGSDGTARLCDLQGQYLTKFFVHQCRVYDVQFSPQGDRIVTSGDDGTAWLWDLQGQELTKF